MICRLGVLIPPDGVNFGVNQKRSLLRLSPKECLQVQLLLLSFNLLALRRTNGKPGNSPRIGCWKKEMTTIIVTLFFLYPMSFFYIPGAIIST